MPTETLRVFPLETEQLDQMIKAGIDIVSNPDAYTDLPTGLSIEEVDQIGAQVVDRIESLYPSRDGMGNGFKARRRTLESLGFHAIVSGDLTTARSVADFLKRQNRLSLNDQVASFVLRRLIRREQTKVKDGFWAPNN